MATKKSLVEVTHDDGYGDSLLMHINSAFGGKDMRADKIVNPVAPAMQIEGIPDGHEPARFDYAVDGEVYMKGNGEFTVHVGARPTQVKRLIIRKIEKPKQYRPFANAAEFRPHKNKWVTRVESLTRKRLSGECQVVCFDDDGVWLGLAYSTYKDAFDRGHTFDDGTPFGVEVVD